MRRLRAGAAVAGWCGGCGLARRRQEHLERAGYRIVRVMWEDIVRHPAETIARIQAALGAA